MKKYKSYIFYGLVAILLVGGYLYLKGKKGPQEPAEPPQPPNIEKVLSEATGKLREAHEEELAVWEGRVKDLVEMNNRKDQDINRLKARRQASNKSVKDDQLLSSVNNTIIKLKILGYE